MSYKPKLKNNAENSNSSSDVTSVASSYYATSTTSSGFGSQPAINNSNSILGKSPRRDVDPKSWEYSKSERDLIEKFQEFSIKVPKTKSIGPAQKVLDSTPTANYSSRSSDIFKARDCNYNPQSDKLQIIQINGALTQLSELHKFLGNKHNSNDHDTSQADASSTSTPPYYSLNESLELTSSHCENSAVTTSSNAIGCPSKILNLEDVEAQD
jgi:hypothetical protein